MTARGVRRLRREDREVRPAGHQAPGV